MRKDEQPPSNPFTFGAIALDDAFTDRDEEVRALASDMRNGQDVLVYAPRRYGKSSLVLQAAKRAVARGVLVGYCDVMKATSKERLAAALAKTIYEDLLSPAGRTAGRAATLFRGLRVRPAMELDPEDGLLSFSFRAGHAPADIDDAIERLLELPGKIAADRGKRVVLVLDEFQEIVSLDRRFPNLLRAVFQTQPAVGHVYLGSKRHVLDRIFDDANEPFWRSSKRLELGVIPPHAFIPFLRARFDATGKGIADDALERLLAITVGHPYATQELAYAVWELVSPRQEAFADDVEAALDAVLRSERNHLAAIWDDAPQAQRALLLALAEEPAAAVFSGEYRQRHGLPGPSSVDVALKALVRKEVVGRDSEGRTALVEPFLADWLRREQRDRPRGQLRRRR